MNAVDWGGFLMVFLKTIQRGLYFINKQEGTFKINMVRVASQNFLITPTMYVYQSIYIVALGATPIQLAMVYSVGGVAATIITIPSGWLADKYGIKKMFSIGTFMMILGAFLFALASNWIMTIPAMIIFNTAYTLVVTLCPTICGSCLKSSERATGMQLCDSLSAIPSLIAPIIGAVIVTQCGGFNVDAIRPLYWMQVVGFSMLLMLILKRFANPSGRKESKVNLDFVNSIREVFLQGTTVKRYIVYSLLFAIPFFVTNVYLPLYAMEVKGASEYVVGSMKTASWILPLLLAILIGRLADIFGRKRIIYITTLLYCISFLFLVYAIDPNMLIISGIFQGFYMLAAVTSGAISAELVPISILGRWFGIIGFFRGLVSIVGPIIGGILWSIIGPSFVFFFLIVVMLMSMALLMTIPETLKKSIT